MTLINKKPTFNSVLTGSSFVFGICLHSALVFLIFGMVKLTGKIDDAPKMIESNELTSIRKIVKQIRLDHSITTFVQKDMAFMLCITTAEELTALNLTEKTVYLLLDVGDGSTPNLSNKFDVETDFVILGESTFLIRSGDFSEICSTARVASCSSVIDWGDMMDDHKEAPAQSGDFSATLWRYSINRQIDFRLPDEFNQNNFIGWGFIPIRKDNRMTVQCVPIVTTPKTFLYNQKYGSACGYHMAGHIIGRSCG
uniref:Uncharacterized protein n=1 Tax=Romanomermis culicivorax TaxID=13658 RepID=A0A915KGU2_ROMCU